MQRANSKIAMITSLIMNAINITGNGILIYGLKMGVAGAAIPTLVSRMIAALIMIGLLRRQNQPVHMSRKIQWHFDRPLIRKILHVGVPNGLENGMFQLGKILVLSLVSTFGTASIAANAVSNTIAMFQILPGMAINFAILTVAAQCVGANRYDQVRYYTVEAFKTGIYLYDRSKYCIVLLAATDIKSLQSVRCNIGDDQADRYLSRSLCDSDLAVVLLHTKHFACSK